MRADGVEFDNLRSTQFEWLRAQGFDVVEYYRVTSEQVAKCVAEFEEKIQHYDVPSDGLVVTYNDIAYGRSLGRTAKISTGFDCI